MEFVEQLKSSVDIVSVVGEYVRLRKAGGRFVGLCPFHSEKTPSFGVHGGHQFYKCFGCGAGGDVIKFVMEIEAMTFWEAVTHLAERNGIPIPQKTRLTDEESALKAAVYEMHELAGQLFQQMLASSGGAAAREYVAKRAITPEAQEEFGLGFVDRSGQTLVRAFQKRNYTPQQMEASGLVMSRQDGSGFFDRFRGRLMFPIHNESGKIIAFAGRAMSPDDEPKYMNSPETAIYRKSYVLYNLNRSRKHIRQVDHSILVEGYMDVIGLHQAGVYETVASCGTALTDHQVRSLRRHSDKIVVNFDPDAAGSTAAERSVQMLLEEGLHVRVLQLQGGLDPDDFVQEHGGEAYREVLKRAPSCFHWLADRARSRFDMTTAEGRVEGFRQILLPAIQRLPQKLERAAVAEEVASYLRVDPALVRNEFRRVVGGAQRDVAPVSSQNEETDPKQKLLINVLLKNADARREVLPRLGKLRTIEQFRIWPLLRVMIQLDAQGRGWGYAEVEGRLNEEEKALLAAVVFADPLHEQEASLEQALSFLPTLERKEREAGQAELKQQIRSAEQAGDLAEVMRLMEALNRDSAS
jgi:DNA primase